ncbi:MAG: hypothetical protein ACNYZG_04595 [Gammaproteobacteria bacterium]
MKYSFLSLLLLYVPAHADKIVSNQECRQMYQDIVINFEASKIPPGELLSYYGQMCIPANKGNPEYTTVIDAVISDELVVVIKAKLAEQDVIKL